MVLNTGGAAAGGAFWRFSLRFYAQPGVAAALILLQDEAGCDVNLILYSLWLGLSGRGRLDGAALATAERATHALRDEIVAPLRRLRRRLAAPAEADLQHLYKAAKRLELAAERAVQHRLGAGTGPAARRRDPGRRGADAEANLTLALGAAAGRPEALELRRAAASHARRSTVIRRRPTVPRKGRSSA